MLAQGAVAAIRTGCQMLSEGKADLDKFKKTVEKGVGDAKAIYKEARGLWSWLKGLFAKKASNQNSLVPPEKQLDDINVVDTTKSTKKAKRLPDPELTYEEFQAQSVHEICENMKVYFEAIRALKAHCRELEHDSATTDKVASSAIDRIEIEWQLKQLSTQVREAMVYTPEHLGLQDLYARFLAMYEQILDEQEFARDVKAKKDRDNAWRHEHRKEILIYKAVYAVAVIIGLLELIGLYSTL
jgi:hypothetical protein